MSDIDNAMNPVPRATDPGHAPIGEVQRQLFLRSLGATGRPGGTIAILLAKQIKDRIIPAGEVIFTAGTPPTEIFFVARGEVELRAAGQEPWRMTPPSVIGAIDALNDRPHARTAVAATDVHALALPSDEWFDAIEENFEVARDNMMVVAESLARLHLEASPDGAFPEPAIAAGEPVLGLSLVERILLLRETSVFRAATIQALARLAEVAEEQEYPKGRTLYRAGEPAHSILVIATGLVEIAREDPVLVARFGAGDVVGGSAGVGVRQPTNTATALAPTVVLAIRREDFFDIMEDHFDITRAVMMGLSTERERVLTVRADRLGKRVNQGAG